MLSFPPSIVSPAWRYALVGGVVSIPLTAVSYREAGSELSLAPIVLGGVLAGYLSVRRTGGHAGVGWRTGVIGWLPVMWPLAAVVAGTSALAGPAWFVGAGIALTLGATATFGLLALGVAAGLGAVGARVGGWIAVRVRHRPPASGE